MPAAVEDQLAAHDDVVDSLVVLERLEVGRPVDDPPGIEDRDVREIALPEASPLREAQLGGVQRGHLAHGVLEAQEPLLADVVSQDAGEGAEVARVRLATAQRPLDRVGGAVGADGTPGLSHGEVHVLLGVVRVDRADGAVLLEQEVEEDVQRIDLPGARTAPRGDDPIHGLPLEALVRGAQVGVHQHAIPVAADGEVVVVPALDPREDVLLHAGPLRLVPEARQHRLSPALVSPGGDDARQVVVAPRVGVDVRLHVDAAGAGLLEERNDVLHASPVALVGDLQVDDVDPHAGALADLDGLLHRLEDARPLVPDVAREDAAVLPDDPAELDQLVRRRQETRRRGEHAREPGGAVLHRLPDEALHLLELLRSRRLESLSHDTAPDVAEADVGDDVRRDPGALESAEVVAKGGEAHRLPTHLHRAGLELALEGPAGAALAEDLGGHPLADLALRIAVLEEQPVGVGVHVDETRSDDETAAVDRPTGPTVRQLADRRDAVSPEGDIPREGGLTAAVDDPAPLEDQVERLARGRPGGRSPHAARADGQEDGADDRVTEIAHVTSS